MFDHAPIRKFCTIREQIIVDRASGLTFQFEVDENGLTRFHVFGGVLPWGNREIVFNCDGHSRGGGTLVGGLARPAWTTRVSNSI